MHQNVRLHYNGGMRGWAGAGEGEMAHPVVLCEGGASGKVSPDSNATAPSPRSHKRHITSATGARSSTSWATTSIVQLDRSSIKSLMTLALAAQSSPASGSSSSSSCGLRASCTANATRLMHYGGVGGGIGCGATQYERRDQWCRSRTDCPVSAISVVVMACMPCLLPFRSRKKRAPPRSRSDWDLSSSDGHDNAPSLPTKRCAFLTFGSRR